MAKDNNHFPAKRDLERLLKEINTSRESVAVTMLKEKTEDAQAAFDAYTSKNATYRRLSKAADDLREKQYRLERRERKQKAKEVRECRNALLLRGVTPALVDRIEKLVRKYSE